LGRLRGVYGSTCRCIRGGLLLGGGQVLADLLDTRPADGLRLRHARPDCGQCAPELADAGRLDVRMELLGTHVRGKHTRLSNAKEHVDVHFVADFLLAGAATTPPMATYRSRHQPAADGTDDDSDCNSVQRNCRTSVGRGLPRFDARVEDECENTARAKQQKHRQPPTSYCNSFTYCNTTTVLVLGFTCTSGSRVPVVLEYYCNMLPEKKRLGGGEWISCSECRVF
jgi:hypothetical protein